MTAQEFVSIASMIESLALMQYDRDIRGDLALRQWTAIGKMLRDLANDRLIAEAKK